MCNVLQSRLLSLTPHVLHASFHIPPSRYPDSMQRSRMFQTALQDLSTWWANDYFDVLDATVGMKTRSWDEVMEIVEGLPRLVQGAGMQVVLDKGGEGEGGEGTGKGKAKAKVKAIDNLDEKVVEQFVEALGEGGERIRTVNSLMKKALQGSGGRDTSAQLFVALCRALGLGARLVVSLQALQWRADQVKSKSSGSKGKGKESKSGQKAKAVVNGSKPVPVPASSRRKGKMPEKTMSEEEEEDDFEEVEIPGTKSSTSKKSPASGKFPSKGGIPLGSKSARSNATATASESEATAAEAQRLLNVGKNGAMNPATKQRADYYKLKPHRGGQKLGGAKGAAKEVKRVKHPGELKLNPHVRVSLTVEASCGRSIEVPTCLLGRSLLPTRTEMDPRRPRPRHH